MAAVGDAGGDVDDLVAQASQAPLAPKRVGAEWAIHGGDLRHRWTVAVWHDRRSRRYDCSI